METFPPPKLLSSPDPEPFLHPASGIPELPLLRLLPYFSPPIATLPLRPQASPTLNAFFSASYSSGNHPPPLPSILPLEAVPVSLDFFFPVRRQWGPLTHDPVEWVLNAYPPPPTADGAPESRPTYPPPPSFFSSTFLRVRVSRWSNTLALFFHALFSSGRYVPPPSSLPIRFFFFARRPAPNFCSTSLQFRKSASPF